MVNRSGGAICTASPSIPRSSGPSASTSNSVTAQVRTPGSRSAGLAAVAARNAFTAAGSASSSASTPSRPLSRRGRLAMLPGGEPYGLFEICRTCAAVYRSPAGPVKAQRERPAARSEQAGQRAQGRLHLRLPVGRRADDLGVETQRRVVDEHPAVHLGEVHPPLAGVSERVQRTHDVPPVETEVHGQVVPRARRHDDHGDPVPGDHARDRALGAVAAGHADDVRALGHRLLHEPHQIGPLLQDHRLDPARPALLDQAEALGLAAAAAGVDDQDGVPGRRHRDRPGPGHGDAFCGRRTAQRRPAADRDSPDPTSCPTVAPIRVPMTTSPG